MEGGTPGFRSVVRLVGLRKSCWEVLPLTKLGFHVKYTEKVPHYLPLVHSTSTKWWTLNLGSRWTLDWGGCLAGVYLALEFNDQHGENKILLWVDKNQDWGRDPLRPCLSLRVCPYCADTHQWPQGSCSGNMDEGVTRSVSLKPNKFTGVRLMWNWDPDLRVTSYRRLLAAVPPGYEMTLVCILSVWIISMYCCIHLSPTN